MSRIKVCCPSCGFKRPKLVTIEDRKHVVKCPTCGLNTGPKKNPTRALNAWNAMAQLMLPSGFLP